ncbi:MAG: hypothetical protein KDC05_11240 [Bacteroidales bacterium]|nr:hypothetical protein [Bacteroidales bacterium]
MKKSHLILVLILLLGCKSDEATIEKIGYESIGLQCLFKEDTQYIITSEEAYIQMARQIYDHRFGHDCADTTKAPFDFGKFVLIGKYTSLDENDQKSLTVIQNNIQQRLLYKMTVTRVPGPTGGGFGNFYSSGMNWVKVAKPPAGYAILIDFTEN